mgnify:CR=1 FL=1
MIDEIQVKDVALIREASLSPSPRLTVLTGETGAGKTALVSAVKLLVGERADSSCVREGAKNAEVRGRLFPSDPTAEELVAVRKVSADGRSRATINGAMASVSELARTVGPLVELCGQHEYQSLLKPAEHGRILDGWADLESTVGAAFREALADARAAETALEELRATASASNTQLEEARFTLQQIEAVNPEGGEYEETRDWLARAEHAEVLARNSHGAAEALSGDGGALDALNTAISLIEEGTPVIAAATYMPLFDKAMSNVVEVQARGAQVLALTTDAGAAQMHSRVERVLTVPETETMLLPQLGVVPLQLLAYYIALERGCDIDKPRNLAKSVTVE